jgi:Tol biopolymer transport system component
VSNVLKRETEAYSGNGMPLWDYSPDGKYVAFLSKEGSKTYLNITMVSGAQHVLHREIYDDVTGINGNTSCFAWSLNPDEIAFIAENEQRTAYPHLLNFSSNTLLRDTTVTTPAYITRAPLSNRFAYKGGGLPSQGGPFTNVTDFSTPTIQYPTSGGGGLKWSPDEKFFLYEWQGTVGGAFGYDYSQLYLYSIDKGKYYRLTKKGDINRNNFYFEWAKTGNQVFFERFGKICAVEFRLPE